MSWKIVYEKNKQVMTDRAKRANYASVFLFMVFAFGWGLVMSAAFIPPVAIFCWMIGFLIYGILLATIDTRNTLNRMEFLQENKRRRDSERTR